jgi:drug/metabolite transporter (DMT)-like permease
MRDYIRLHLIVLLFGFTAILGKLSHLPAVELVCYRTLLAALSIFAVAVLWFRRSARLPKRVVLQTLLVGSIVAAHWVCFFQAVKVSNVSVALGCMASSTLFTSLIEPLFERRKIRYLELFISILIVVGLYIITQFALHYWQGIAYALSAAFLAALFSVLNRKLGQQYDPLLVSGYEMAAGTVLMTIYIQLNGGFHTSIVQITWADWAIILFLSLACTTYAFTAIIELMRRLSAFSVNVAISLEPIYGIILAYFIFGNAEQMHFGFYIGTALIIAAVIMASLIES